MGVSDVIASFINEILENAEGCAEIQRAELAQKFNCVPSQINYVIATRFSPEHGYIVESRRGGNGYIRIRRACLGPRQMVMHAVNAIGDTIDDQAARAFLSNLSAARAIEASAARLIAVAVGENTLRGLPPLYRNTTRASLLKQMLLNTICAEW